MEKTIKTILLSLLFCIGMNGCSNSNDTTKANKDQSKTTSAREHGAKVVAHQNAHQIMFDMNLDNIRKQWNNAIELGDAEKMEFNTIDIKNDSGNYLLTGSNSSNSRVAAISLLLIDNNFYEEIFHFDDPTTRGLTVVCNGCASGCYPKIRNGVGYCEPYCIECKKREILTSSAIFQ